MPREECKGWRCSRGREPGVLLLNFRGRDASPMPHKEGARATALSYGLCALLNGLPMNFPPLSPAKSSFPGSIKITRSSTSAKINPSIVHDKFGLLRERRYPFTDGLIEYWPTGTFLKSNVPSLRSGMICESQASSPC